MSEVFSLVTEAIRKDYWHEEEWYAEWLKLSRKNICNISQPVFSYDDIEFKLQKDAFPTS